MWVVRLICTPRKAQRLVASHGVTGALEESAPDRKIALSLFFEDEQAAHATATAERGTMEKVPASEVALAYQDEWAPLLIGSQFLLHPPWITPEPTGRIALVMQPGVIFGSGDHATTQLCLELLEDTVRPHDRVLDVGTGTGILAIASKQLGASHVSAFDIDSEAVHMAATAAKEAGVTVSFWQGSWESCRAGMASGVCVNLPGAMLLEELPHLLPLVRPSGWMVLSGILEEQRDAALEKLRATGGLVDRELLRSGWSAIRVRL